MIGRLAMLVALAATVHAADAPAPPPASSARPAEDAIATAKKEFAEIKAATSSPVQQGLTVPKEGLGIDLRDHNDRIEPPAWLEQKRTADRPDKNAKKSANWLLDAMTEKDGRLGDRTRASQDRGGRTRDDDLADQLAAEPDSATQNGDKAAARGDDDTAAASQHPPGAVNPLATYMAAWMTPKDFALLKPGMFGKETGAAGNPLAALALKAEPGRDPGGLPVAIPATSVAGSLAPGDANPVFSPQQNPFLADLPSVPSPSAPSPLVDLAPLAGPPAAIATPPPLATPPLVDNRARNDVLQARDDEKYFKQLKRF